jgi:hypothetical protein
MTREQMIEELVEDNLYHVSLMELVYFHRRRVSDKLQDLSDDELLSQYNSVFGDEEVVH